MSEPRLNFKFYTGGIEDGMIAKLADACPYARDVAAYEGELDADNLREALQSLELRFPLFLVSYAEGKNKDMGLLAPQPTTAPKQLRHECTFTVICCDDDARGARQRRRGGPDSPGVFGMISDADGALTRMQFVLIVGDEKYVLNTEPLNFEEVEIIAHLPEMTVYAMHFSTAFVYQTPDRRAPGAQVQEIEVEMFPAAGRDNTARPGVTLR